MRDLILDLFYPPKCLICGELLLYGAKDRWVCPKCQTDIPFLKGPHCRKCGSPLSTGEKNSGQTQCGSCRDTSFAFERGYAAFSYADMKYAISRFKFSCVKECGIGLGRLMTSFMKDNFEAEFSEYDFMVPVPIHKKRRKERGFNQTEVLAEEISRLTGKPCQSKLLLRSKNTKAQNALSAKLRKSNIKYAFEVADTNAIEDKKILLIDDIFTTGGTVNECARSLYMAGASEVSCFALSVVAKEESGEYKDD